MEMIVEVLQLFKNYIYIYIFIKSFNGVFDDILNVLLDITGEILVPSKIWKLLC